MKIKNHRAAILKIFSVFSIFAFFLAGAPLSAANAQDAPIATPTEASVETPTPDVIEPTEAPVTPVEPALPEETPTPQETATEVTPVVGETPTPSPTEESLEPAPVNFPPSIRIIQPSNDISIIQGDSVMIQWEDEDPDDNALINVFIIPDENEVGGGVLTLLLKILKKIRMAIRMHIYGTPKISDPVIICLDYRFKMETMMKKTPNQFRLRFWRKSKNKPKKLDLMILR